MTIPDLPVLHKSELHLPFRGFIAPGRHCHPHDELLLVLRGSYHSRVSGGSLALRPGQAVWYPAGLEHQPREPDASQETAWLYASFTCGAAWRSAADRAMVVDDRRSRLQALLLWMTECTGHASPAALAQTGRLLAVLLGEFVRLAGDVSEDDRLAALLDFIAVHLQDPLTIDEMARFVGLGRRQFERRFRQRCGCAPKAWVRRCRLEKALHLRQAGLALAEIAPQVGRRSVAHLSRELAAARQRSP
jgi:AraC-like DNA-binding protein